MKITRKLIPAFAMMLIAAILATSASYAWFTMSDTVTATNMGFTATAPTSLLISSMADGSTGWSNTAAIKNAAGEANARLHPVSSWNGSKFFSIDKVVFNGTLGTMYAPYIYDGTNPTFVAAATALNAWGTSANVTGITTGATNPLTFNRKVAAYDAYTNANTTGEFDFIDYTMFLKTQGDAAINVSIDPSSIILSGFAYTADLSATISSNYNDGAHYTFNGLYYAAVPTTATYNATTTYYTQTASNELVDAMRLAVVYCSQTVYDATDPFMTGVNASGAIHKNNVYKTDIGGGANEYFEQNDASHLCKGPIESGVGAAYASSSSKADEVYNSTSAPSGNLIDKTNPEKIFTIDGGDKVYCVVVRLWLEGQDVNCKDAVATNSLKIQFAFKAVS